MTSDIVRFDPVTTRRDFARIASLGFAGAVLPFSVALSGQRTDEGVELGWTQWGGPQRRFSLPSPGTTMSWSRPELRWKRPLGKGQAAVLCDSESSYSVHLQGDNEIVQKRRIDTGDLVWECPCPVTYHAWSSEYDGPHATPLLDARHLYVVGIDAQVRALSCCCSARTGSLSHSNLKAGNYANAGGVVFWRIEPGRHRLWRAAISWCATGANFKRTGSLEPVPDILPLRRKIELPHG